MSTWRKALSTVVYGRIRWDYTTPRPRWFLPESIAAALRGRS